MLSALFLTIAFSVLVTFLFEKPILKFFKTRFNNR
jgi:peptidoglycan/LPS O-acetylase OafA/YrhL